MIELIVGLDRSGITFSAERIRPKIRVRTVFIGTPDDYGFEVGNSRKFLHDLTTVETHRMRALLEVLLGSEMLTADPELRLEVWGAPAKQPEFIEFSAGVA